MVSKTNRRRSGSPLRRRSRIVPLRSVDLSQLHAAVHRAAARSTVVRDRLVRAEAAGDESLEAGLVAAATLGAVAVVVGAATFRFRAVRRAVEGHAIVLIEDGHVNADVVRSQRITDADLRSALHEHGVLSVAEVRRAFIEPGGQITMITRPMPPARGPHEAPA
jgi:hypothetical protein